MKNKTKIGLAVFIVGIILIAIGIILIVTASPKTDPPKKENEKPVVDNKNIDNNSNKIAIDHVVDNIVLNDIKIIKRDEIEAITGYVINQGEQDLTNIIIDINLLDKQGEVLETVSINFDTLPADKQKYYIESNMKTTGIVNADDYKVTIRKATA